jgi:hypothetical protein
LIPSIVPDQDYGTENVHLQQTNLELQPCGTPPEPPTGFGGLEQWNLWGACYTHTHQCSLLMKNIKKWVKLPSLGHDGLNIIYIVMQVLDMSNYCSFKSVHQVQNYAATDTLYKLHFRLNSTRKPLPSEDQRY